MKDPGITGPRQDAEHFILRAPWTSYTQNISTLETCISLKTEINHGQAQKEGISTEYYSNYQTMMIYMLSEFQAY